MIQAVLVVVVVALAIFVGQYYPVLGGLIATFPIKIFAYAIGGTATEVAIWGLVVGSVASSFCALAIWFSLRAGLWPALLIGLAVWLVVAVAGGLFRGAP